MSPCPDDKVLKGGQMVGIEPSEPGTEVTLVWGEAGSESSKPVVERRAQSEIRAVVDPVRCSKVARETCAEGRRAGTA